MKKIVLIALMLILGFTLTACNPDTSKYAGSFVLDSYEGTKSDEELGFKLIESYDLTLKSNGMAVQVFELGVMLKPEKITHGYNVNEEEGKIYFKHSYGMMESYTEIWDYDGEIITMTDLLVAIVDDPVSTNEDHFITVTIKLKRVHSK